MDKIKELQDFYEKGCITKDGYDLALEGLPSNKCSICGSTPCAGWSKTSKPLCELCIKHKDEI